MPLQVMLTGAAGHLGSEVCRALVAAGHTVRAADRAYRKDLPVPVTVVDLVDYRAVYPLVEGCQAVAHMANHPNIGSRMPHQLLYAENVSMDINVFQAAVDAGVKRLMFASSVQAMSGSRSGEDGLAKPSCLPYLPIDGDAPARPGNLYALSKEAGEQQLRHYAARDPELSCTAVRFPFILGRRHLEWFRREGRGRPTKPMGPLDEAFAYLSVSDAASLVVAILERQAPGYHQLFPAAPDPYLAMPVAEIVKQFYPGVPLKVPLGQMRGLVDISAMERALGWTPKDVGQFGGAEGARG